MTWAKWGMAALVAVALSPAYAEDQQAEAQQKVTEARQDAAKEKADAQQDASKKKAEAQKELSDKQAEAQKDMAKADQEAQQKTAKADEKANEKISDARKDEAQAQGKDVRASEDRAQGAAASTAGTSDSKKAPLSATAKKTMQSLYADSQMEVGMARIAKDKAQNDKVKDLAGKIEDDHQKLADRISDMARDHGVQLAAHQDMAKNRKHVEQMQKMSGAAFDEHYVRMMEQEHKKDIADLRKVQSKLHANKADEDVAKLVDDSLEKLNEHEKLAVDAQAALRNDQRQGRRGATDSNRTAPSSWPNTAPNTSAGADTATGPHTGADTTTDQGTHGTTPGTSDQNATSGDRK